MTKEDSNTNPDFNVYREAWRLLISRFWMWLLLTTIYNFGNYYGGFSRELFRSADLIPNQPATWDNYKISWIVGCLIYVGLIASINSFFTVGLYRAAFKQVRGESFNLADLFQGKNTVAAVLANLLYQLAVIASSIILVFPGFVVAGLGILTVPIALETGENATESFKKSWAMLKRKWIPATIFTLMATLLSASGIILFGFGIFLTTPLLYLCVALLYRNCFGMAKVDDGIMANMPLPPQTAYRK